MLEDDGAAAIAHDLLREGGCSRLRDLQLDHCGIGDGGAAALGEALRDGAAPSLQNLWLGGNRIGDYGAEVLAVAVTPATGRALGLRRLALHANPIADAGALAIARALEARRQDRPRLAHGGEGGPLAVLTVMLYGHRISDGESLRMVEEVDAIGARCGGDRIELHARTDGFDLPLSSRAPSASPSVMQSPLRAPPPTWSSSPGAQQYPSQQYGSGYHGLL